MKALIGLLLFGALASAHLHAQSLNVQEVDVSNQIVLPRCELEVQLSAMRWQGGADAFAGTNPPDYVVEAKIKLNGRMIKSQGFLELLGGANRVQSPPSQVRCGFVVATGDAATSRRVVVRIEKGRIVSAERIDPAGLVHGRTLFYYPKALVLN